MKQIPLYKFYKHKYGNELLVDIVDYRNMRTGIHRTPVFTETFYSITLVREGDEVIEINGQKCRVKRGTVICSIPGEVWRFHDDTMIEALNLVFEKSFLLDFFRDSHFLDQFPYLSASRPSPFFQLSGELLERVQTLFDEMQREINTVGRKDQHILRAMLYETLILLLRAEADTSVVNKANVQISQYVERFEQLVEDHFTSKHGTEFYAGQLCITSNYLNKMVRQALGTSTKAYIQERCMREACHLLTYTSSVQELSEWLGYETATYFVRTFRKLMGKTPLEYRRQDNNSPEK